MPAALSEIVPDSGLIPADEPSWPEPGAVSGYYGPQDKGYLPNSSNNGPQHRPPGPPRTYSDDSRWGSRGAARPVQTSKAHQPNALEGRHAEIVDSYQEDTANTLLPYQKTHGSSGCAASDDEEMPNFEASDSPRAPDRGTAIDHHLHPRDTGRRPPPMPAHSDPYAQNNSNPHYNPGREVPRSRSQPDSNEHGAIQEQNNSVFNFDLPNSAERRPATSASTKGRGGFSPCSPADPSLNQPHPPDPRSRAHQNSRGLPPGTNHRGNDRFRGPEPGQMGPGPPQPYHPMSRPVPNGMQPNDRARQHGGRPSPQNTRLPTSPPDKPLPNPNALPHRPSPNSLPHHPAPVRQGVANGPQPNQAPHPPPVRQYNSPPADPVQKSTSSRTRGGGDNAGLVTPQELENLRQKTLRNPNDSPTQFLLAKKLFAASAVLLDPRADPATRKRNHDKYQADALKIIKKLSALSYLEADFFYADCYSRGALGLQSDIKEAFLLYQKAAKANHAQAAYRVAVCCEL